MAYTRKEFIEIVAPLAQKDAAKSNVLASLTIAQAILESADGNSGLTKQGNALFGIKATGNWKGKVWTGKTLEYYDGKNATSVIDGFRAYENWSDSITDHSNLLICSKRYAKVVGENDYKKACTYIHQAGYATDPNYAAKLISIIETNNLTQYDIKEDKELASAVSKIIKKGIKLDFNSWKRKDLIKLSNVHALVDKLGGIEHINKVIKSKNMNFDLKGWENMLKEGTYTVDNIRSLIIKYAIAI